MKRHKPKLYARPEPRGPKETCSADCGNTACPVNLRNTQKGDNITVESFFGTGRCRGYMRP